jgi:hypothetical protein
VRRPAGPGDDGPQPAPSADSAYANSRSGVRCALTTRAS